MRRFSDIDHSEIFLNFQEIESLAYRDKIRYFEKNESQILSLDFEEYVVLLKGYLDANFEIGAYYKYIFHCDQLIEYCITENLNDYQAIYQNTLFKKAASYFNTGEYEQAIYILQELLKMDSKKADYRMFLRRCHEIKDQRLVKKTRAISIFLFLLSACIICFELLIVNNFYEDYAQATINVRSTVFISGFLILAGGEIYQKLAAYQKTISFLRNRS